MRETTHDVPDRGPDIVVTAPRPIVTITIADLKLIEEKFADYLRKIMLKDLDKKWPCW